MSLAVDDTRHSMSGYKKQRYSELYLTTACFFEVCGNFWKNKQIFFTIINLLHKNLQPQTIETITKFLII